MPTAILGDRAAGKTTFIGLLYAAQIKFSNEPANKDVFRFYADPVAMSIITKLYNSLKTSAWPGSTEKGQKSFLSFLFGYEKLQSAILPRWIKVMPWVHPFSIINFNVYDVAGEDIQDMTRTPDGLQSTRLTEIQKSLLESRVLVILIDCSKITGDVESDEYKDMLGYDGIMATLISLIAKYNSEKDDPAERKIYPVIVLTKFDTLFEEERVELMKKMGLPTNLRDYAELKDANKRREHTEKILRNFFGQTLALLKGGKLLKVSFDRAGYFYSHVNTKFGKDGRHVPAQRLMDGGAGSEVDFSYDEYARFIMHFRKIANEMPDDVKEKEEITFREK
ncbi:MAG: hypothetical protein AB1665_07320 [Candidatus Thermoplasmatota archaeon]